MSDIKNGNISHWADSVTHTDTKPSPVPQEQQDLLILGAGLTGLWTAYYAAKKHPDWKITILEAESVGFGASGRNGGWLSPLIPGNRAVYARKRSQQGIDPTRSIIDFQESMNDAIEETLQVLSVEDIDADQHQGGHLQVATTEAGFARLKKAYEANLQYGYSADRLNLLEEESLRSRINITGAIGGLHFKDTARVHPAKLTKGLAQVVSNLGVTICAGTRVYRVNPGNVQTNRGPTYGHTIVSCLESYSGTVACEAPGFGNRQVIPVNSAMIVTEPLTDSQWESIGWHGEECLNDAAHTFIYAQRTKDGRIAIGGRGTPYKFNSGTAGAGEVDNKTIRSLTRRLGELFPTVNMRISHAWKGTIGVTRDWCAGVFFDDASRIGTARGFAGHGVTATNLAARTLLHRIDKENSRLTRLPWNDHNSGQWEPEPVRFIGVHAMYRLFGIADFHEELTNATDTSLIAKVGSRLAGLHE